MRDEERAERLRWKTQLRLETDQWTGRAARAHHHAKMMMATLDKFIADACRDAAFEELLLSFFTSDTEIVRVPPERDAEHAAALKAAALTLNSPMILKP